MTISPVYYSNYQSAVNIKQNNKRCNNPQSPEKQVAFKGLEKVAIETTKKNKGKILPSLAGVLGITALCTKITDIKTLRKQKALKKQAIEELSKTTYRDVEIIGRYPGPEVPVYVERYCYTPEECKGIAEFVEDRSVYYSLCAVIDPGTHPDISIRALTKDEILELGNTIKKYGESLITDFTFDYSQSRPIVCNKGAKLIKEWKPGEPLEDVINRMNAVKS